MKRIMKFECFLFVCALLFQSISQAHLVAASQNAPKDRQPISIEFDIDSDELTIDAAEPDSDGVSINEFKTFTLKDVAPRINVDGNTKKLVIRVMGGEPTYVQNVQDLSVDGVELIIENPSKIFWYNSTIYGSHATLLSPGAQGQVTIGSAGLNSTHPVTLQGGLIEIDGLMMVPDLKVIGDLFKAQKEVFAEKTLAVNVSQALENRGWLQGMVVSIDAPLVTNVAGKHVGIAAISFDGRDARKLKILTGTLTNHGQILSEGEIHLVAKAFTTNHGKIASVGSFKLESDSVENFNEIQSGDSLLIAGVNQGRARLLRNTHKIRSNGPMDLAADQIRIHPAGLPSIDGAPTATNIVDSSVMVDEHEFELVEKAQIFQSQPKSAFIETMDSLMVDTELLDNVLSQIKVRGEIIFKQGQKTDVRQHSADLIIKRELRPVDVVEYWSRVYPDTYESRSFVAIAYKYFNQATQLVELKYHDENGNALKCDATTKGLREDERVKGFICKAVYVPYSAAIVSGTTLEGEVKNLKLLNWQQSDGGHWFNSPSDSSIKKEDIQPADQIIWPDLDWTRKYAHLYKRYTADTLASKSDSNSSLIVLQPLFSQSLRVGGKTTGDVMADLLSVYKATEIGTAVTFGTPDIISDIVSDMRKVSGILAPTQDDLVRNGMEMIQHWRLPMGVTPSLAQIASLTKPIVLPISVMWDESSEGKSVLVPVVYLDPLTAAMKRAQKNTVRAEIIDLTVTDTLENQGTIESIKGNLRLYAKKMANNGAIASAQDIDLLVDEELLIATIVDEITGAIKGRASVVAQGKVSMDAKTEFRASGAEVKGNAIHVRSDGNVIIVPQELVTRLTEEIRNGFTEERRSIFCKDYVQNHWEGDQAITIEALGKVQIAGGKFQAKDLIKLKSTNDDIVVDEIRIICDVEITQKKHGWLFGLNGKSEKTKIHTEQTSQTALHTAGGLEVESGRDVKLAAIDVEAATARVDADGDIGVQGGKSTAEMTYEKKENLLFGSSDSGKVYAWGHESTSSSAYDETVEKSKLKIGDFEVSAGGKVKWAGADLTSKTAKASAENGVDVETMDEIHEHKSSTTEGGLELKGKATPGELSASIGIGVGHGNKNDNQRLKVSSTFTAEQKQTFDAGKGDVHIEGASINGDVYIRGRNVLMTPAKNKLCFDNVETSAFVGLKAGVKSRLIGALADICGTAMSKIEVWEDGVNIGFKALKNGVDLISGLLVPFEAAISVAGEASYTQTMDCYEVLQQTSIEGGHFDIHADNHVLLQSVDIETNSGRVKAKSLNVSAERTEASSSNLGVSGSFEVPVQGVGVLLPSVSVGAQYKQSSERNWINSAINVKGLLELDIEDDASFQGAQVKAGELLGNFGSLLVQSLTDEMEQSGGGGSISINPAELASIANVFNGGGFSAKHRKKSWVSDITSLLGVNQAKIVVKKTLALVGGVIANAERFANGTLTDNGKLEIKAAKLIIEDVATADDGFAAGLSAARGIHEAIPFTLSGEAGYTDLDGVVKATLGQGKVEIDEGMQDDLNRDVLSAEFESGIDIKPIEFYIPIIIPDKVPDLLDALKDGVTDPIGHMKKTFYRNMQGMTWFVEPSNWIPINDTRLRSLVKQLKVVGEKAQAEGDDQGKQEAEQGLDDVIKVDEMRQHADDLRAAAQESDDPDVANTLNVASEVVDADANRLEKRIEGIIADADKSAGTSKRPFVERELHEMKSASSKDSYVTADAIKKAEQAIEKGDLKEAYAHLDKAQNNKLEMDIASLHTGAIDSDSTFDIIGTAKLAAMLANPKLLLTLVRSSISALKGLKPLERLKALRDYAKQFGKAKGKAHTGAGNAADAVRLRAELSFREAGLLDADGKLTEYAIRGADKIDLAGEVIKNPSIVKILTKDGSKIQDWAKFKTESILASSGQRLQIHFYKNTVTGKIDYITRDFKVKGVVKP